MSAYWLLFAIPALVLFWPAHGDGGVRRVGWLSLGMVFTLMIGFRYQVGGDWDPYLAHYDHVLRVPMSEAIDESDPGYALLNWLSGLVGGGIYLVNLVCGAIIMAGVIRFSQRQPLPWLSVVVATPFMIMVVAMGYTRQSAALGFELLALVALLDGHRWRFVLLVVCGALFHKSAIVLLPLAMLGLGRHRLSTVFGLGLATVAFGAMMLAEHYDAFWRNYVEAKMASEGGFVRVVMNALPAVLLLMFRKKLEPDDDKSYLWVWIAVLALACIPLVDFASTAVDRMALYLMPIQLYVFSRVHRLFTGRLLRTVAVVSVVVSYGTVHWVWLNFANHAHLWLPYQFYPFVAL